MKRTDIMTVKEYCREEKIKELENIREEINQIDTHQFNRTKVLKILDNHIKENKQW